MNGSCLGELSVRPNVLTAPLRRLSTAAIAEILPSFDKNPTIRAMNPVAALSAEAKRIFAAVEREREEAKDAGLTGDWWEGERKKGITEEQAKAFKAARTMVKALEIGDEEMEGMEGLAGGLGAMLAAETGLGPGGGIGFDYEGFDHDGGDDEAVGDEKHLAERLAEPLVVNGGEKSGEMDWMEEGLEEGKRDEMDVEMDLD
ncbi:MAG: hypothetical protein Q9196_003477 [Gyalolechia fulgens]